MDAGMWLTVILILSWLTGVQMFHDVRRLNERKRRMQG
jgi:hypothetical protein